MAAGLGFKTFTTGEVLTAADTNGYLMQGVLVFASAAARDAAITSPQEGQCCYLKDTDAVLTYSGAAWVGFDDSNAIQNSIVDAKGDLVAASGADTPARLAVGSNGETLVADSAATTGLRYQEPKAANPILNSSFQIWQRGTSISYSSSQAYSADRWNAQINQIGTISRQVTGDTTNLPNIQYCARVQRTSGQTGTSTNSFYQNFESVNSIPFVGKTVTYSFYARKGANYSPTSNALVANVYSGTGTDQNVLSTYTGSATVATTTVTLTATWQRFSVTGTVATSATELALGFSFTPTGTAGADDYYEVTGVQLEVGSVATPFKTNGATIQGELAAAQRYYYVIASGATAVSAAIGMGFYSGTTTVQIYPKIPVTLRTTPTLVTTAGTSYFDAWDGVTDDLFDAVTLSGNSTNNAVNIYGTGNVSGTQFRPCNVTLNNASASIAVSAEL